jgi:pimeloyl-ACP methyl ester carboxylesterase
MARAQRRFVEVDGVIASYLTAGDGPIVLLLHGTYWSRVWLRVVPDLAAAGLRPVAVDLPGFGLSGGELDAEAASVPRLTEWLVRFLSALGETGAVRVAGHDIGGALAQRLLVHSDLEVPALALVNAVTYDSWPVASVARFRDPAVARATTIDDLLEIRRRAVASALGDAADEALVDEYLEPLRRPRAARSWIALAEAADSRFTLDLLPALRASAAPKLLVWGEDDPFQRVEFAERFVREIPHASLRRIAGAGHIPMENDPAAVGRALAGFFA